MIFDEICVRQSWIIYRGVDTFLIMTYVNRFWLWVFMTNFALVWSLKLSHHFLLIFGGWISRLKYVAWIDLMRSVQMLALGLAGLVSPYSDSPFLVCLSAFVADHCRRCVDMSQSKASLCVLMQVLLQEKSCNPLCMLWVKIVVKLQ